MELQNLQSIFNERIFRIPDYQRGYSWDEQQLRDLWRDIEILGIDKEHYTGVLSVVEKQGGIVSIVDGQQRITSLIILIQVICDCEQVKKKDWINKKERKDYEKKYLHIRTGNQGEITKPIFGYEKDNPSHVYFKTKILGLKDMEYGMPNDTLYTLNLGKAKEFFKKKIKILEFNDIEIILKKITENLRFNYYAINNELNEFVAFETMNNRGKILSDLELLKNRLIYLSTLLDANNEQAKKQLRKDINDAWKTIYEYLGKNPENILDDDDFLRQHWIMYFQFSRQTSKDYKDFLLNKHFIVEKIQNKTLRYDDIRDYAQDIQEAVKSYYYIHNPEKSQYSNEIKKWLHKLNRLNFGAFRPLIMSALTCEIPESNIVSILKFAERFLFVAPHIKFHRSNYKDSAIYGCAHKCHKSPNFYDNAISELPDLDSSFLKEEFYDCINNKENSFYYWNGLYYFLYEYELSLQELYSGEIKIQWDDVNEETIEHILPQNDNAGGWEHFSQEENRDKYLHDLGNLLLLSRKKNSELQDKPFKNKKQNFSTGSYSAIEVSQYEDWTIEAIEARKNKMISFLLKRWKLNLEIS